jgi:hypothetical protein
MKQEVHRAEASRPSAKVTSGIKSGTCSHLDACAWGAGEVFMHVLVFEQMRPFGHNTW